MPREFRNYCEDQAPRGKGAAEFTKRSGRRTKKVIPVRPTVRADRGACVCWRTWRSSGLRSIWTVPASALAATRSRSLSSAIRTPREPEGRPDRVSGQCRLEPPRRRRHLQRLGRQRLRRALDLHRRHDFRRQQRRHGRRRPGSVRRYPDPGHHFRLPPRRHQQRRRDRRPTTRAASVSVGNYGILIPSNLARAFAEEATGETFRW